MAEVKPQRSGLLELVSMASGEASCLKDELIVFKMLLLVLSQKKCFYFCFIFISLELNINCFVALSTLYLN